MMKRSSILRKLVLVALLALTFLSAPSLADTTVIESDDDISDAAAAAAAAMNDLLRDITIVTTLPSHPSKQILLGESVEVLLSLRNRRVNGLNISAVFGRLGNEDFYQNLTTMPIGDYVTNRLGQLIEPDKEASFSYRFTPASQLPPGPYQVTLFLQYEVLNGAGDAFAHYTFFNQTVELVEKVGPVDFQLLFILATFLVVVAAVGWVMYEMGLENPVVKQIYGKTRAKSGASGGEKKAAVTAPANDDYLASFLKGTAVDPARSAKKKA